MNRDRGVGGGQREEEMAIEDGGGWKGNPHPSFGGGEEQLAFPVHFLAQSRTYFSPQVVEIKPGSRCF